MKLPFDLPQSGLSRPLVMGVLNTTPDSFSDGGGCFEGDSLSVTLAVSRAAKMVASGADIIDIGGESTRPGADPVSVAQELQRVIPVINAITQKLQVLVSVDTSTPEVITQAAAAGAHLINDVRALQREGALEAAAATGLPVCLMHMQGQPKTMQNNPQYAEVTLDVIEFLQNRIAACVAAGIDRHKLLIDPGFGFGKSDTHNLQLLQQLPQLVSLNTPILVGLSRKSLLGRLLNRDVDRRLAGSLAFALMAAQKGANIIRVHDVEETVDVLRLWQYVEQA